MLQSVWASLTKHASGDVSQFVDLGMDALAVLGHGHRQLCLHRRELIKPHLSRQYVHLCSPSVPFTNQLFGSDVDTLIENITNTNKVSNKIVRNNKFQGQGRARGRGRGGRYLNYRTRGQQPHRNSGQSGGYRGRWGYQKSQAQTKGKANVNNQNQEKL